MKERTDDSRAMAQLISAMSLFGTIGIFVRYIPLPSSVIALARGVIGTAYLLLATLMTGKKLTRTAIRRNLPGLCLSGALIGFNWILLFESYRYTTVATATLCYYMAPMFVILASPLVLKERLTARKFLCVVAALLGMALVSGILQTGISSVQEMKGVLLGVGAAALYASVVMLNKLIRDISAYDKTILQLASSSVVVLPYVLLTEDLSSLTATPTALLLLAVVGVLHTGIAYTMYFGSLGTLRAQTAAIFSYIDPVVAIILSAVILKEPLGVTGILGAVMILGAALVSELPEKEKP